MLKKSKSNDVIIKYSMMSGVKLTILLPTINQLIRHVVTNVTSSESDCFYVMVLCHSHLRCQEMENFLKGLTAFLGDVSEVIGLY